MKTSKQPNFHFIPWTKRFHLVGILDFLIFTQIFKTNLPRLGSSQNLFSLPWNRINTPPRCSYYWYFLPVQVLCHMCCACAQLQSSCWHLDTEPVTQLSHRELQLEQVRTARSCRFEACNNRHSWSSPGCRSTPGLTWADLGGGLGVSLVWERNNDPLSCLSWNTSISLNFCLLWPCNDEQPTSVQPVFISKQAGRVHHATWLSPAAVLVCLSVSKMFPKAADRFLMNLSESCNWLTTHTRSLEKIN